MADYFEEMGWRPLAEGEQPNRNYLDMARFMIDAGIFQDPFAGEWPRLPPPAAKSAVESLQEIKVDNINKECPVCLKKFKLDEIVKKMPCEHTFHTTCILTWLNKTNSCPCCRYELPTECDIYESYKKRKDAAKQREETIDILHNSMFS